MWGSAVRLPDGESSNFCSFSKEVELCGQPSIEVQDVENMFSRLWNSKIDFVGVKESRREKY